MIKCGSCGSFHGTVNEVKACHAGGASPARPFDRTATMVSGSPTVPVNPPTEKQITFAASLLRERCFEAGDPSIMSLLIECFSDTEEQVINRFRLIERSALSKLIDQWTKLPKVAGASTPDTPKVPAGYYATPSTTGHNDLDFWAVQIGEGKWEGRTFVKRVIGGRPAVNVPPAIRAAALASINALGVEAAGKLYAEKIGNCYRCNRHLTDEVSRAAGLGPICRSL